MIDIKEEGKFVNMLNETVNYTNWDPHLGEPNNRDRLTYGGDCVRMIQGKWYDTSCFGTFQALCSKRHISKYLESQ